MKMKKKTLLAVSFALSTVLVVGQLAFAAGPDDNSMRNSSMSSMMNNPNMGKMMEAMNSPEGQKMMDSCGSFMNSYGDQKDAKQKNLEK